MQSGVLTPFFCKLCFNKKYSLRKQLSLSFGSSVSVSLAVAAAVVLITVNYIGDKAESQARFSLESQIERHITDASNEAAATIGEGFRTAQYAVLDVTAFAFRDAIQEDLLLDGGGEGYPLTPAHIDLRDTEIANSTEADLVDFDRQDSLVDLSRSVWYYSDLESFTVEVAADDQPTITQTARLDLLWPTMYLNANDTKNIYVGIEFTSNNQMFRQFPGSDLSGREGSDFACEVVEEDGSIASGPCYDLNERPWFTLALADPNAKEEETQLGVAVVTPPYTGAAEGDWMVTLARAVYGDSGSTTGDLLGVVGVDVKLEQVQRSVEGVRFLEHGYSILTTAEEGIVLAAGIWNRSSTTADDTTVCDLGFGICSDADGDRWEDLLAVVKDGGIKTFTAVGDASPSGDAEESILVAAPVTATFDTSDSGGAGTVTHYILSAVPKSEIYQPVDEMTKLIRRNITQIIVTTAIVAGCTLLAVGIIVCVLSASIARPIVEMTKAANSIAERGAEANVFEGVKNEWGTDTHVEESSSRHMKLLNYLRCRGEDEISTLAREFSDMITGLGRRRSAAGATSLADVSGYVKNPFVARCDNPPPSAPSASVPTDSQ